MTLQATLTTLFTEVFEGTAPGADGTWFVQGGEALEETLSQVTAGEASVRVGGANSIAAHVIHTTYFLQMSNAHGRNQGFDPDWEGSWHQQVVTDQQWIDAQAELKRQKQLLLELMNQQGLSDGAVFGAVANIGHAAYHLGAIRQLLLSSKSAS